MYDGPDTLSSMFGRFSVLTSVTLSLELLLIEGFDLPLTPSLSLSLQLFCPGFSCKTQPTKQSRVNTVNIAFFPHACLSKESHRSQLMNMGELAGSVVLSLKICHVSEPIQ